MKFPWQNKKPILSPVEGYNRWAPHYGTESNPIRNLSNEWIEKMLPDLKNKNFLDAGCGTGYFCKMAEERHASKITGIDISPAMIAQARKNCPSVDLRCEDISTHPLEKETYDVILLALVLGHIADLGPVLANLAGALKDHGILLISDFHPFLTLQNSKRTFRDASGNWYEIKHHLHLFQDIIQNIHQHKVMLNILEEPLWQNMPAIYALKAIKQ